MRTRPANGAPAPPLALPNIADLLAEAFAHGPAAIAVTRLADGTYVACNDAFCQVTGFSRDEILGRTSVDLGVWVDPAEREALVNDLLRDGFVRDREGRCRTKSGATLAGRYTAQVVERDGEAFAVVSLADESRRQREEREVRRRDEILDAVAFAAERFLASPHWEPVIGEVLEELGRSASVSRVYVFQNQTRPDGAVQCSQRFEWVAEGIQPLIDEPMLQDFSFAEQGMARWERVLSSGEVIYGNIRDFPQDEHITLEVQEIVSMAVVPIFTGGDWWGFMGFDECFAEREWTRAEIDALRAAAGALGTAIARQLAESKVRETERRYRMLVERLPLVTYVNRADAESPTHSAPVYISPQLEQLVGYTPEEWITDRELWIRILHPDDRDRAVALNDRCAVTGEPFSLEYRVIDKNGRTVWLQDEATYLPGTSGGPGHWQGLMLDVSRRKEAEEALRDSEERYRQMWEGNRAVKLIIDPEDGRILDANPAAAEFYGYPLSTLRRMAISEINTMSREEAAVVMGEVRSRERETFVFSHRLAGGEIRSVLVNASPVEIRGRTMLYAIVHDITEQRRAEEQLREAEERLRTLVERVPAVTYTYEEDEPGSGAFSITYASPQVESLLGYTADSWTSDPDQWRRAIDPRDRPHVEAEEARTNATGEPFSVEYRHVTGDGRTIWVRDEAVLVPRDPKQGRMWQGVIIDITDLKNAQERLREAEARFRALVEQIPAVTYTYEEEEPGSDTFRFTYASPQLQTVLGHPVEEWLNDEGAWARAIDPGDRDRVLAEDLRTKRTGDPFSVEYRHVAGDGRMIWVRESSILVRREPGKPRLWQGVIFDITDLKDAEEQLRVAEAKYRTLVENMPAVSYVEALDANPEDFYMSPQVKTVLGYDPDQFLDPGFWASRVHPDDRDRVVAGDEHSNATGEPFDCEFRYLAADGREVWVHDTAELVRDVGGEPLFWQGLIFDVTDRRRAEDELKTAEAKYRTLVEQIPAMSYIAAPDGESSKLYVSPQFEQILGYPVETVLGDPRAWREYVHPEDRERVFDATRLSHETGEPFSEVFRVIAADGRVLWVRDESVVVRGDDGSPSFVQGVMFDITEEVRAKDELQRSFELLRKADEDRRRLLERLVQAQEDERQRIAADIHDDSIQKITAVGLRLQTLARRPLGDEEQRMLGQLEETVQLSIGRLRRLMFELRPPALDRDGLAAALGQQLNEMAEEAGWECRLENRLVVEPPPAARTIAYRIAQEALSNVWKHAGARRVDVLLETREEGMFLRIKDDGTGFDRRATESAPGHLGLSAMRERAELAGGRLRVDTARQAGTSIELWLPVGSDTPAEPPQEAT